MAKNDLVMLDLGYYGRYVLPVKAATTILSTLVESGATRVDVEHISGGAIYYPAKHDASVRCLDGTFDPDIPMDSARRQGYFDWINTKSALAGSGYQIEPYAAYLAAKEES